MSTPRKIFVSYSHEDEWALKPLEQFLGPLAAEGMIDYWVDTGIDPGNDWDVAIRKALAEADVAVLLLSQAFLASQYIREVELFELKKAATERGLTILTVVLKPFDSDVEPELLRWQMVNEPDHPLSGMTTHDCERVWLDLAKSVRKVVSTASSATGIADGPDAARLFLVPHERNFFFTGRDEVLREIESELRKLGAAGLTQATGISGLGGVGKTQTAVEYAYRHRKDYLYVLWAQAQDASTLGTDYRRLAKELRLPGAEGANAEMARALMLRWLETERDYLLILDNADEPDQVKDFLPITPAGHLLVTSRSPKLTALKVKAPTAVKSWTTEEGAAFLLERTDRIGDPVEERAARELSEILGGLPLAVEQAAAYIVENGPKFDEYVEVYQQEGIRLLDRHGPDIGEHPVVARTYSLNLASIQALSLASIEILQAAAFLAPEKIPYEIFEEGAEQLNGVLASELTSDRSLLRMAELLAPLKRYSLIEQDSASRTFSVHRIVQAVVRDLLPADHRDRIRRSVLNAVERVFPDWGFGDWSKCQRVIPHAHRVSGDACKAGDETLQAAEMVSRTGGFLSAQAEYLAARSFVERSLQIREKMLGYDHPETAKSLVNFAGALHRSGDLEAARPIYQRAVQIFEKDRGPDHPDTAKSLNNLACLLREQGDLAAARPIFERALAILEMVLGPDHPDTAGSLIFLGALRRDEGDLAAARPLFERALSIREKALGPDHPDTATSLSGLGGLFRDEGDLAAARPLFERALSIREKALGPDHPDTAASLSSLAVILRDEGDLAAARPLFERALATLEKALGPDHPDTAASLSGLGGLFRDEGDPVTARLLFERALSIREKALGPDHPDTAASLSNLGGLFRDEGDPATARLLFERALVISRKALGSDHPRTGTVLNNLGVIAADSGDVSLSAKYIEEALRIRRRHFRAFHPYVTSTRRSLANLYRRLNRTKEAKELEDLAKKGEAEFKRRNGL